jgi:arylformamidase
MAMLVQDDELDAPVFLHYTQRELDRNFDQRGWAGNALEVIAGYVERSALARQQLSHENIAYGATPDEVLDVFPAAGPNSPVLVFVHGGAWRNFTKRGSSFVANALTPAGITVVVPGFASLPQVRLPEMVTQVRRAMDWTCANVDRVGGDAGAVHLAGWSSGAHLAAMALITDCEGKRSSAARFQSITCISTPFDLEPVMLSVRSSYVKITREEERSLSPRRNVERYQTPFVVISAEHDTDEFRRQSDDFSAALTCVGCPVQRVLFPGVNHFELIDTLGDASSALSRFLISRLKRPTTAPPGYS